MCVQLANITVYYILMKLIYSKPEMMQNILDIKRFIDDGTGLYTGTQRQFEIWLTNVNNALASAGLNIDESNFQEPGKFVNFLDIQFCFDANGLLQTDLYIKETDARSYLNFSSAHPNHTFSAIVYAQCLRLRRIINSQARLQLRLLELARSFEVSGYPFKMVDNITKKVLNMDRDISVQVRELPTNVDQIKSISTFESDECIMKTVKSCENSLKQTVSFRNQNGPLFSFIKRVGPSIKSMLNDVKYLALGPKHGHLLKCNAPGCKCCRQLMTSKHFAVNGKKVKFASGSCKTYNICYIGICNYKSCNKPYIGRTVDPLHIRVNGHRHFYKEIIKKVEQNKLNEIDTDNDQYSLGLHLYQEHSLTDDSAFDRNIRFAILEVVSPSKLEVKEYMWMHRLKTFQPNGLNTIYPFGISNLGVL